MGACGPAALPAAGVENWPEPKSYFPVSSIGNDCDLYLSFSRVFHSQLKPHLRWKEKGPLQMKPHKYHLVLFVTVSCVTPVSPRKQEVLNTCSLREYKDYLKACFLDLPCCPPIMDTIRKLLATDVSQDLLPSSCGHCINSKYWYHNVLSLAISPVTCIVIKGSFVTQLSS